MSEWPALLAAMRMRSASLVALVALVSPPGASGEPPAFLPDVSVRLQAARYFPSEAEFEWAGWIGAGASLVRLAEATAYVIADVETILGNERRPFEANQANYHLELGVRRSVGGYDLNPFFHHVSRHAVDRDKGRAVDWNILGVRASRRIARPWPAEVLAGVGHTTQVSLAGYRWELTGGADIEWLTRARARGYGRLEARLVTAKRSPAFPRDGFLDFTVEGGARWLSERRALDTFLAFERRHDVFLEAPGSRDRVLLGFRIRLGEE